ncbi:MAG: hypothetical protein ACMVO3_18515 [Thalassobaculum sp.]
MQIDLVMALAIVYLVMAILFESFLYPIIIVFSVPAGHGRRDGWVSAS